MKRRLDQKRWTAAEAQRELDGWRRSGESMAAYCRRRGYQAQRLSWWRKRLEAAQAETASVAETLRLAPAVITGGPNRRPVVVTVEGGAVRVELDDAGAVHPAWIAELAEALRSGAPA